MTAWIQLIAQVGIPLAFQIWKEWSNKQDPTEEDWQKLLALSQKTALQYEAEAVLPVPTPTPPAPTPTP